ncbi:MAG: MFS transporter [Deltaproteobacteria bacterium]|nr:MFS transporter [Deltaproteobacteria bacterium]
MPTSLYDRNYILLNISNFLYSLYATMFIFLPAFLYRLDLREGQIGLLMATGTLVSVSLKPATGLVVDRFGRTAFLVSGAFLACASTIPWLFVTQAGAHLYAIRLFQGAAYSFFATASYAWIAAAAPPERRGEALGVFGLSFFVPTAIGGGIGDWIIGRAGFHGLFISAAVIAFLSGLCPFGIREPARGANNSSFSSLGAFLTRPYFIPNTAGFLFGVAYGSIFTFLPVFLLLTKIPSIGIFVLVYAISVIATRTLARTLSDRMPRERLSLVSLLLMAGGILAIPSIHGPVGLSLVAVVTGIGHGFLFPSLSALVLDRAGRDQGSIAMAMFTGAFDMGLVIGAAAFGFIAENMGYRAMFSAAAGLTAAGALFFFTQDPAFRRQAPRPPGS